MPRVLIIDDDPAAVMMNKIILEQGGYEVEAARSAAQGIEMAMDHPAPDLILMDKNMPEISGIEAVKMLRSIGYKGKIVALTGTSSVTDRNLFLKVGCDSFITKPVTRDFLERIAKVLLI